MSTKRDALTVLERLAGGPLSFGRMIESLRFCDEINQTDLARRVGVSKAHLCDIEKGRRLVSPERAAKFARVMGYGVETFVAMALEDQLKKARLHLKVSLKAA